MTDAEIDTSYTIEGLRAENKRLAEERDEWRISAEAMEQNLNFERAEMYGLKEAIDMLEHQYAKLLRELVKARSTGATAERLWKLQCAETAALRSKQCPSHSQ